MSRAFLISAWLLSGCADDVLELAHESSRDPSAAIAPEEARLPVIYGEDDRREVFAYPDLSVRSVARQALVALVPKEHVLATGGAEHASVKLAADSLADAFGLCASERFLEQPTAADCSGILIAPDLVLTAGHCFEDDEDCDRFAYVFDYAYAAPGRLEVIDAQDVSYCHEIVVRELSEPTAPMREDFAVVRLRQPVSELRHAVSLRRGPVRAGDPLTVLGFPSGLPAKIDDGAIVRSARVSSGDYFTLDSDTFRGSSGSPVLDSENRVAGVLVRGSRDYIDVPDAGCAVARTVSDEYGEPWEQATYATRVLDALCEVPERAPDLCKSTPLCGDGVCERAEASRHCPADCLDMCSLSLCKPSQESNERSVVEPVIVSDAGIELERNEGSRSGQGCRAAPFALHSDKAWLVLVALSVARSARRRSRVCTKPV